jgi:hypothetical protein
VRLLGISFGWLIGARKLKFKFLLIKSFLMRKLIFFLLTIILIFPKVVIAENDIKKQLFACETLLCDESFLITSINIKIQNNKESIITINTAKYNESDYIKISLPMILPSNYQFTITNSETKIKNTELFGANIFEKGKYTGDKLISVDIPITQFIYYCEGCVKKLSDEPFGRYRFLFPFAISKNNIISSGIATDAIFPEIPNEYEFKGIGKDNVIGGLVKIKGDVNTLPEDLNISEIPESAFGLKLDGKRVIRLQFDAFNHVILFEYGRPLFFELIAIISPILLLFLHFLLNKKYPRRTYEIFMSFFILIIGLRWYFVPIINLVLWDLEISLIVIVSIIYFFKREYFKRIFSCLRKRKLKKR